MHNSAAALIARLAEIMAADGPRLARRIEQARARKATEAEWTRITEAVERSAARRAARAAAKPRVTFPPELPVSQRAPDIAAAIEAHPVVIVCGETGSGKTTQLPKICLEAGRGVRGQIGHTQPRRIAARAVAARIAQELGTRVGEAVGYKVRFTDHTSPDAYIKLMTDGILLAETERDRALSAYDTIIVDEAHERSLNIDFLLGYLAQLLRARADLKVVITSATLDAERFARHFASSGNPAPVIEASGRLYPVDVRYRPLAADDEDDEEPLEEAIVSAVEELWREAPGDVLAFLPGEREIREVGYLARRSLARRPYAAAVEILPLYARLSVPEQQRIFAPSSGRRLVLATNVAETSLTVPGIRYVVDPGLARIKRYSLRNKTTLLQIEKIAQSAANQRAGRCGRVADGVCVRLYDEEDFDARARYTDPEILRSSLASVILRMASLGLTAPEEFPFVDPPSPRAIADGYQLLAELEAVDANRHLTASGRELAKLPLDPRIGRILQAARERDCVAEALVIASALAVPDPRERPLERAQAADQAHLKFRDDRSDFLSLIALWEFFAGALAEKLSHRKLVERCRAEFVSYLRLREWRDVHEQLGTELIEAGWTWRQQLPKEIDARRYAAIHQALLAGLLSNIGSRNEDGGYDGARGIRFYLHPGSGIARKAPKWVLAAELTETTRLFARCAAAIEPEWIEAVAGARVERDHFDAHWDSKRGEVVASERVKLFGLTLVARRPVSYGRIDAAAARDVFVREALVAGDPTIKASFLDQNRRLIAEVAELEHKARRQDVLVDEDTIAAFYAERIPADVSTRVAFDRWRAKVEKEDSDRLRLTRDFVMRHVAANITEELFPKTLATAGASLPLKYRFAPGDPWDGVTVTVPLALLNQIDEASLSWLVPGMVRDKVAAYLKALPKALRGRVIPIADVVTDFLSVSSPERGLEDALRAYLTRRLGEPVSVDVFTGAALPSHLAFNVRVVDADGRELGASRDVETLRAKLGEAAQMSFAAAGHRFERKGITRWDFGDLPETLALERNGARMIGYPALIDDGSSASLALLDTRDAADAATRAGIIRLLRIELRSVLARFEKPPQAFAQAALELRTTGTPDALRADVEAAIVDRAFIGDDPLPRDERAFGEQAKRARTRLPAVVDAAWRQFAVIAHQHFALSQRLAAASLANARFAADLRAERDALVYPGFFTATPWGQLQHLPRYLRALERRYVRQLEAPGRDARHAAQVAEWWARYRERAQRERPGGGPSSKLVAFRWLLEELKVSLFAQELRTPFPVSFKRVERAWNDLLR